MCIAICFHQTCDIMPFDPKVNGKEKAVKEERNQKKRMCVKKTMFPCCRTVCCTHLFALIFPLQGGNETKRTEQEGNRVSSPVLVITNLSY